MSFAWTTPALLAGAKTVTRRDWKPKYARWFQRGELVAAFDRSPRYGGKRVATIRLTCDPYVENTADAPDSDFEAEGLAWMKREVKKIEGMFPDGFWNKWRRDAEDVWVIRFSLVREEEFDVP